MLAGLAAYVTLGAILLVPDRGDDFRRLYVAALAWAEGANPYAVRVDMTGNLNHPLLLPYFWLFTRGPFYAQFLFCTATSLARPSSPHGGRHSPAAGGWPASIFPRCFCRLPDRFSVSSTAR